MSYKSSIAFILKLFNFAKDWGVTIITFITFTWQCLSSNESTPIDFNKWLIGGGFALLLILALNIWNNWPRKECSTYFSPGRGQNKIRIIIQEGNVLKQKGIKVIHCQDTFETFLEKSLKKSLLRGFLSSKEIDISELNMSIENSLRANISTREVESPLKEQLIAANMKTLKYDMGTVVKYKQDYLLVAFSTIEDVEGHVDRKNFKQYTNHVRKAFEGLNESHKGSVKDQIYNVGVWGYINNGPMYDTRKRIEIMVKSFIKISRDKPFCETLRICLLKEHVKKDKINFSDMQLLLDYIVDTTE